MAAQSQHVVKTYSHRREADYAVKALVLMAGFDSADLVVDAVEEPSEQFRVCVVGSEQTARDARSFLQGPSRSPNSENLQKSPYGLKNARDLMAMDDFG